MQSDNVLKRYGRRPKELSKVCLADFIAWFNCTRYKDSSFDILNLQDENTDDHHQNSNEYLEPSVKYQMRGGFKF